ncbi:MAG: hypothetical protein ACR2HH_10100 [Chthoniobacterales bacterium]
MIEAAEFHRVSARSFVWNRYDSSVKAELFSTGLGTAAGLWLVDPFSVEWSQLSGAIGGTTILGVVVTNENHWRAAAAFGEKLDVPIHAHPEATAEPVSASVLSANTELAGNVIVVPIDGAPAGEIALFSKDEGGTVVIGDALINFGAHGFTFLPAKYCANQKRMRTSLRQLLDYQFERLLFAHGEPILTHARQRLAELLG